MYKRCKMILKELENEGKIKVWWDFTFPQKEKLKLRLKDMLEDEVDEKYYLKDEIVKNFISVNESGNVIGKLNMNKWQDSMKRIYDVNKYSPAINTYQGGNTEPKIITIGNYMPSNNDASRIVNNEGLAPTVKENHGTVTATNIGYKIRKLTPKECWRLMGFSDKDFEKAQNIPTSNTQLYKQARKFDLHTSTRKNI